MLSESERELIARAVGGRLPAADALRMRLLLDHSREARRLARGLRRERESLRQLPVEKAPDTILPNVMSRIAGTNPFETIPSTRALPIQSRRRPLIQIALVASITAAFGAMLLSGLRSSPKTAANNDIALALPKIESLIDAVGSEPRVVVSRIPDFEIPETPPQPKHTEAPVTPRKPAEKPLPILGAPYVAPARVEIVLAQLPQIVAMKELGIVSVRKQLIADLSQVNRARIDLFVSDPIKAAELLVTTGRAESINVAIDSYAKDRQRQKIPTTWLIYTESLSAEEIVRWMTRLATADSVVFRDLHMPATSPADVKDLKDLLGLDPSKPSKVSETSATRRGKDALLVSYLPTNARTTPSTSAAVKTWIDRRGERAPGKIELSIVVRTRTP